MKILPKLKALFSSFCITLVFFLCPTASFADQGALVGVVVEAVGDRVVLNRGIEDGVRVGQTWTVVQDGRQVGKVTIESLRERSASGVLEGEAKAGALMALGENQLPAVARRSLSRESQQQLQQRKAPTERSLNRMKDQYRTALNRRTQSRGFSTPTPIRHQNTFTTGLEAYNLYSIYDYTATRFDPTGSFVGNPLTMAALAANFFQRQQLSNQMWDSQKVRLDVQVTHWDEALVDLQTEVMASEEGLSVQETLARKIQRLTERGADRYAVFEVHIKNVGQLPAQLEPFKYRVFLMDAEGQPIGVSRIDEALDKTLRPGDEVRGFLYFPKIVVQGQKELRLAFEQMFGDRGTLVFSQQR